MQHDASYPREEPGAGNLHARIREGESRMAELLDQFRHSRIIQLEKRNTKFAEAERDLERRQKEGLREAYRELKPDAPVMAIEIGYGDPALQEVVKTLADGNDVITPVNPTTPVTLFTAFPLSDEDVKKVAAVAYTSANGLSRVVRTEPGGVTVSSSTPVTTDVARVIVVQRRDRK